MQEHQWGWGMPPSEKFSLKWSKREWERERQRESNIDMKVILTEWGGAGGGGLASDVSSVPLHRLRQLISNLLTFSQASSVSENVV